MGVIGKLCLVQEHCSGTLLSLYANGNAMIAVLSARPRRRLRSEVDFELCKPAWQLCSHPRLGLRSVTIT